MHDSAVALVKPITRSTDRSGEPTAFPPVVRLSLEELAREAGVCVREVYQVIEYSRIPREWLVEN